MGVPGFFRWIYQLYREEKFIIKNIEEIKENIESLYLDLNGLLHPQCFKILDQCEDKKLKINVLEDLMIKNCIKYMDNVIRYVNPTKLLYIAIDGILPMAKIKQQRYRRYKSVNDKILFDNVKRKYNVKLNNNYWNNSAITSGTIFIEKIKKPFLIIVKLILNT